MATRPESSRQAKRNAFAAESQQRIELNAQIAGIAGAFEKSREFGSQVLVLQQALLAGLGRSQQIEAKRLSARFGKDDRRAAAAAARGGRYDKAQVEVESQVDLAARVVETVQRNGIFSGYVYQPDGAPAPEHTVRLTVEDIARKSKRRGSAKTGADGYFRMILSGGDSTGDKKEGDGLDKVIDKVVRAMLQQVGSEEDAATPEPAADRASAAPSTYATTIQSQVEILDTNGRVVHEDPIPPTFDSLGSEFRTYLLAEKGPDSPPPPPKEPGKSSRKR